MLLSDGAEVDAVVGDRWDEKSWRLFPRGRVSGCTEWLRRRGGTQDAPEAWCGGKDGELVLVLEGEVGVAEDEGVVEGLFER